MTAKAKAERQQLRTQDTTHRWSRLISPRFTFSSLNVRLLKRILLISALLTLTATGIQLYADYLEDLDRLDGRIESFKRSHAPALALSVWQLDSQLIETQLKSIQSVPDVHSVEVETAYHEHFKVEADVPPQKLRMYEIDLTTYRDQPVQVGVLRIGTDLAVSMRAHSGVSWSCWLPKVCAHSLSRSGYCCWFSTWLPSTSAISPVTCVTFERTISMIH